MENLRVEMTLGRDQGTTVAVQDLDLSLKGGERVGLIGRSGSGKSVTARAISGLLPPSALASQGGKIWIDGVDMSHSSVAAWRRVRRESLSLIFQDPMTYLNPTMRIGDQIGEAAAGRRSADRRGRVLKAMAMSGLADADHIYHRYPFELSGGMRQRVVIAMAIIKEPRILIADEPTTALDVTTQSHVLETLRRIVDELGASLLFVSHDLAVVSQMCERIHVIENGRIIESGTTEQIMRSPSAKGTQQLVSAGRRLYA